jgi:AcrR family transcriptional regulator
MSTQERKQREIREREQQILETAEAILVVEGYHGLSMDRIAETLQYSKGTIYNHFGCKEEIIIALAIDTEQRRTALFDRASMFRGRPRERMAAVGVAAELFYRLHADRFRVEQIVRSASIWEKTSEKRRVTMQSCEARCMGILAGIVRDAIAQGDLTLPDNSHPEDLVFGLWSITYGAYSIITDNQSLLNLGIADPFASVQANQISLIDGYHWRPLSTEHDYQAVYQRITEELFADEFRAIER